MSLSVRMNNGQWATIASSSSPIDLSGNVYTTNLGSMKITDSGWAIDYDSRPNYDEVLAGERAEIYDKLMSFIDKYTNIYQEEITEAYADALYDFKDWLKLRKENL